METGQLDDKGRPPAGRIAHADGPAVGGDDLLDLEQRDKALAAKAAGTKHPSAAGVVKEIQGIISKLPAASAANDLGKLEDFVRNDGAITDAEAVPSKFHSMDIRAPLLKALATMKQ